MNIRLSIRPFLVIFLAAIGLASIRPIMAQTWNQTTGGNWNTAGNWDPATIPDVSGAVVSISSNITVTSAVNLSSPVTVGSLSIGDTNGSNAFQVTGSTVTFNNGGSGAALNFLSTGAANSISSNFSLADSLTIANASNATQVISGGISAASGTRLITNSGAAGQVILSGSVTNGNGTVAFLQNSATSSLLFESTGTNTYSGGATIQQGTVLSRSNSSFGTGTLTLTGGTISTSSTSRSFANTYTFTSGGSIAFENGASGSVVMNGNGTFVGANTITVNNGTVSLSTGNLTGSGSLTKEGAGTLSMNTGNSKNYTGGTTINGGNFTIANSNNIYNLAGQLTANFTINNGSILNIGNSAQYLGTVTLNNGAISGGTLLLGKAYNFSNGTVSARLNDTGALTKSTSGTVTLSAANVYTGGTLVSAGTLIIDTPVSGTNSGTGTGNVTVTTDGILGGSGQIRPGTGNRISVTGGTIAPGSGIGTLTIEGGGSAATILSLDSNAKFAFELNTGFASDRISLVNGTAGDISFAGNEINFTDLSSGTLADGPYTLFTATAANNYGGTFAVDGSGYVTAGLIIGTGLGSYPGSTLQLVGTNIVLNVIPEPSTAAMFGLGFSLLLYGFRRRTG